MARVLFDDVVYTDYGILDLMWAADGYWDGDYDRFFAGQDNGLVGAADPKGIYLCLARMSGGSQVTIRLHDAEPPVDTEGWEDVVEVSTVIPQGAAPTWQTFAGDTSGPLELEPGPYRVRVSARGRDEANPARTGAVEDGAVVDSYLVDFWPAHWTLDAVIQTVSEDAATWHAQVGGRTCGQPPGQADAEEAAS